jgi:imidazolonepropionase-like amidohydrolase
MIARLAAVAGKLAFNMKAPFSPGPIVVMGLVLASVLGSTIVAQQRPTLSQAVRAYVSVDAPLVALTHGRVIDGTGAAPREDQTLILTNGVITAIGSAANVAVPAGAQTIDLTGKSVIPGLVMVHEHLYYPNGPGVYGQLGESFSRLYLSGGVTTMRTGGNVNGFMDLNMMRLVEAGQKPGPAIDATAPYLNGPNTFIQMRTLKGPEDARRQVQYWTDEGATSLKTYMQITRGELAAAINEAHRRGIKVTGHLCSVTYAEAANLGIDNLEHGFFAATDFVADKKPDQCPGFANQRQVELLVDAGFTPLEAISISTLNGAKYLGRDKTVGTLAVGKQADLVVINGNPAATIGDIRKVETVFKQGIGYDPAKLIASVQGKAGIW